MLARGDMSRAMVKTLLKGSILYRDYMEFRIKDLLGFMQRD